MARRDRSDYTRGYLSPSQVTRNLREMGEHVVSAAKAALERGANKVVADAKRNVPVKTGKLRDSIKAVPNRDKSAYKISANAKNNGVAYGQIVEFSPKINKPFLYPALDANRNQIRENIKEAARDAIRRGH